MNGKNKFSLNTMSSRLDENAPWKISDVIFTYVLIFIITLIFVGILLYFSLDINIGFFTAILQLSISFVTLGIVYYIVTVKYQVPFKEAFGIYFHKTPSFFSQGIMSIAAIIITTTIISLVFSQFSQIEKPSPYTSMTEDRIRAIIFLAIFIAPIIEEIFFRGFMQPALIKTVGVIPGIFITALIFGISHTQYLDYNIALISVTTIGIILGITKYYTGSVMPGIFAHLLNNIIAAITLFSIN